MNDFIFIVKLIAALVIMFRCVCVSAKLSRKGWSGHPLQFAGLAICYPLIGGGAVGAALDWQPALLFLLVGMAVLVISDRRILYHREPQ